jgi:hypothetical protein
LWIIAAASFTAMIVVSIRKIESYAHYIAS